MFFQYVLLINVFSIKLFFYTLFYICYYNVCINYYYVLHGVLRHCTQPTHVVWSRVSSGSICHLSS